MTVEPEELVEADGLTLVVGAGAVDLAGAAGVEPGACFPVTLTEEPEELVETVWSCDADLFSSGSHSLLGMHAQQLGRVWNRPVRQQLQRHLAPAFLALASLSAMRAFFRRGLNNNCFACALLAPASLSAMRALYRVRQGVQFCMEVGSLFTVEADPSFLSTADCRRFLLVHEMQNRSLNSILYQSFENKASSCISGAHTGKHNRTSDSSGQHSRSLRCCPQLKSRFGAGVQRV